MTVKDFVNEYEKQDDKNKFVENHVFKNKYVNYEEKLSNCSRIINSTMYTEKNGVMTWNVNNPAKYMFFSLQLINDYSDIEIEFSHSIDEFNLLQKYDLISSILEFAPQKEIRMYESLLKMAYEDEYENSRNLLSYIDGKFTSLVLLLSGMVDAANEMNEENMK